VRACVRAEKEIGRHAQHASSGRAPPGPRDAPSLTPESRRVHGPPPTTVEEAGARAGRRAPDTADHVLLWLLDTGAAEGSDACRLFGGRRPVAICCGALRRTYRVAICVSDYDNRLIELRLDPLADVRLTGRFVNRVLVELGVRSRGSSGAQDPSPSRPYRSERRLDQTCICGEAALASRHLPISGGRRATLARVRFANRPALPRRCVVGSGLAVPAYQQMTRASDGFARTIQARASS